MLWSVTCSHEIHWSSHSTMNSQEEKNLWSVAHLCPKFTKFQTFSTLNWVSNKVNIKWWHFSIKQGCCRTSYCSLPFGSLVLCLTVCLAPAEPECCPKSSAIIFSVKPLIVFRSDCQMARSCLNLDWNLRLSWPVSSKGLSALKSLKKVCWVWIVLRSIEDAKIEASGELFQTFTPQTVWNLCKTPIMKEPNAFQALSDFQTSSPRMLLALIFPILHLFSKQMLIYSVFTLQIHIKYILHEKLSIFAQKQETYPKFLLNA